jgi:hypothetical protein
VERRRFPWTRVAVLAAFLSAAALVLFLGGLETLDKWIGVTGISTAAMAGWVIKGIHEWRSPRIAAHPAQWHSPAGTQADADAATAAGAELTGTVADVAGLYRRVITGTVGADLPYRRLHRGGR